MFQPLKLLCRNYVNLNECLLKRWSKHCRGKVTGIHTGPREDLTSAFHHQNHHMQMTSPYSPVHGRERKGNRRGVHVDWPQGQCQEENNMEIQNHCSRRLQKSRFLSRLHGTGCELCLECRPQFGASGEISDGR